MLGRLITTPAGAWLRYSEFGPPLACYMPELKHGAVSVVWKGLVDATQLREFFVAAAKTLCSNGLPYYRTRILTPTERGTAEAWDQPPLEKFGGDVRFVRFECTPAPRRDPKTVNEAAPTLITWAVLDEPEDSAQESMGVYLNRDDLELLLSEIETLVAKTASSAAFPRRPGLEDYRAGQIRSALQALKSDLAEAAVA